MNEALAFAGEPVEDLAEDDDDDFLEDEENDPEDEDAFEGSPEIGENTGAEDEPVTPVTPPSVFTHPLEGRGSDPVSNLEASLNLVADDRDEEDEEAESGGALWGFGKALLGVLGAGLATAAAVAAFTLAKEKGGGTFAKGKGGVYGGNEGRREAPTATLSNRALQREKSGLGSQRDGMPLCTVRERTVSPVKKGRSPDVLLARG